MAASQTIDCRFYDHTFTNTIKIHLVESKKEENYSNRVYGVDCKLCIHCYNVSNSNCDEIDPIEAFWDNIPRLFVSWVLYKVRRR